MVRAKTTAIFLVAIFIIVASVATAQQEVVCNSMNWQDVYSSIIYSNLIGANSHFLTSTPHGPILLYEIPKSADTIEIVTSAERPFYVGYESLMRSKGYSNITEQIYYSANLELAKKISNLENFIIIDDAYGYNALAVAPYASKAHYYVLFANSNNIQDIQEYLQSATVKHIIIYGNVDREVRNALNSYNPEILNSESGSRFDNNILITEKFSEIGDIKQVILTNGEFLEASMMTGNEAVLFIGKSNVPQEIKDYIQKKGIQIGVLIGNELIGTATDIRRQIGISVFVKFARGSRIPGGTINPVEDLDRFPMPSYRLSMSISSIAYNKATGALEITYQNNVELASYFKTTVTIMDENGQMITIDGDENPVFIDGGETKTITYRKLSEVDSQRIFKNLSADIYTIYGESKTSLENVLRGTFNIEQIDIKDDADIEITALLYDKSKQEFFVVIENNGPIDAYVSAEVVDLWVNQQYVTFASESVIKIPQGDKQEVPIKAELDEEDLAHDKNKKVNVRAFFGERMHALTKLKEAQFEIKYRDGNIIWYVLIAIAAIGILFMLLRKKKKACSRCMTKNPTSSNTCRKCGNSLSN